MKVTMLVTGGLGGGISSSIAGGNFWNGFRQGVITSGLNHVAHLTATAIDYRNKLEKFLDENGIKRGAPASQETLDKLKIMFKDYWTGVQSGQSSLLNRLLQIVKVKIIKDI